MVGEQLVHGLVFLQSRAQDFEFLRLRPVQPAVPGLAGVLTFHIEEERTAVQRGDDGGVATRPAEPPLGRQGEHMALPRDVAQVLVDVLFPKAALAFRFGIVVAMVGGETDEDVVHQATFLQHPLDVAQQVVEPSPAEVFALLPRARTMRVPVQSRQPQSNDGRNLLAAQVIEQLAEGHVVEPLVLEVQILPALQEAHQRAGDPPHDPLQDDGQVFPVHTGDVIGPAGHRT